MTTIFIVSMTESRGAHHPAMLRFDNPPRVEMGALGGLVLLITSVNNDGVAHRRGGHLVRAVASAIDAALQ